MWGGHFVMVWLSTVFLFINIYWLSILKLDVFKSIVRGSKGKICVKQSNSNIAATPVLLSKAFCEELPCCCTSLWRLCGWGTALILPFCNDMFPVFLMSFVIMMEYWKRQSYFQPWGWGPACSYLLCRYGWDSKNELYLFEAFTLKNVWNV